MADIVESVETIRLLFDYNTKTGKLIRRSTGKEAGWLCQSNGYRKNFEYTDQGLESSVEWLEKLRNNLHESFKRG